MNLFTARTRPVALGVVALSSAFALTACGGSSDTAAPKSGGTASAPAAAATNYGPAAAGPHNAADVTFATDMFPHHAQAIEMSDMALKQASDAQVKALATMIKGEQDPEINKMGGWLVGWKAPVPATAGGMGGMAGMGGDGMMSDAEMQQLGQASGAAFDRLWVELMTKHHNGAIAMAQTELKDGQNAEAKQLATDIIAAQTREVATLTALAKTLPA